MKRRITYAIMICAVAFFLPGAQAAAQTQPAQKPTCFIDAQPRAIREGQATRLQWRTDHATDVSIGYIGPVAPDDFSMRYPTAGRADYVLTAKGPGGVATCSVSVMVSPPPQSPPPPASPASPRPVTQSPQSTSWYAPIVSAITYVPNSIYTTIFGGQEVEYVEDEIYLDPIYTEDEYYEEYEPEEYYESYEYEPYEYYEPYEPYDPYEAERWPDEEDPYYYESYYESYYDAPDGDEGDDEYWRGYAEGYYGEDDEEDDW